MNKDDISVQRRIVKLVIAIIAIALFYNILLLAFGVLAGPLGAQFPQIPNLLFVLLNVAILHLVLAIVMPLGFGQSYLALLGQRGHWQKWFMRAQIFAVVMFVLSEPLFLIWHWSDIGFAWQPEWGRWALWIVPLLVAVFLQTSAEEMAFRGFLQGQLNALKAPFWVVILIPAFLWALIHQVMFDAVAFKIAVVAQMFVIGICLGIWRLQSGTLLGPIFFHFFINAFTMLIYGNTLRPTDFYILQADFSGLGEGAQLSYFGFGIIAVLLAFWLVVKPHQGSNMTGLQGKIHDLE